MANLVVQEEEKSLDSEIASSEIEVGEPAVRETGGGVHPLDVANDSDFDAVTVHIRQSALMAEHDEDFTSYDNLYTYPVDSRVPLQPLAKSSVLGFKPLDMDGEPAPDFTSKNDVVGFVDLGNGPRLVEAGYTDSGGTQYGDGGTGNFIEAGELDHVAHPAERGRGSYVFVRL